MPLPHIPIK